MDWRFKAALAAILIACGGKVVGSPDPSSADASIPVFDVFACAPTDAAADSAGAVATFTTGPWPLDIAVDSTSVYWTMSDSTVQKCPTTNCVAPTILAGCADCYAKGGPAVYLGGIVVDSTNVYWLGVSGPTGGSLQKCGIDGCGGQATVLWSGPPSVGLIAIDTTSVYWTSVDDNGNGSVLKCPVVGGCDTPTVLASGPFNPGDITNGPAHQMVIDSANVYWTATMATGDVVMKCSIGGCSDGPTILASGLTSAGPLAIDSTSLYWLSESAVMKCNLDSCADSLTTLANVNFAYGIAVDSTHVYWTVPQDPKPGAVMACAVGGCNGSPTTVAGGLTDPGNVVVDCHDVHWTSYLGGTISATPKL